MEEVVESESEGTGSLIRLIANILLSYLIPMSTQLCLPQIRDPVRCVF